MTSALTEEEFKQALPKGMQKQINPLLLMDINNCLSSQEEMDMYKENLLTYANVLQQGKFQLHQYLNAVKYVSFKVMGCTNKDAYIRTFPQKYAQFKADGVVDKDIASYTTAYNKSKLVNLIFAQTLVPVHIINAPYFQQALNTQIEIMLNEDVSPKVRSDAANSVMTHLKGPETKKIELDIGVQQGSVIEDYQKAMTKMVESQLDLINKGADVKEIANVKIIEGEVIE